MASDFSGLVARVLCERHNQALSALDASGAAFYRFLRAAREGIISSEETTARRGAYLVNGQDVERWFLKILFGAAAGGLFRETERGWTPPKPWLRVLYGTRPMQQARGLYLDAELGQRTAGNHGFSVRTLRNLDSMEIAGVEVLVDGFRFCVGMRPNALAQSVWRPGELQFVGGDHRERVLRLAWERPYNGYRITINVTPSDTGE